MSSIDTKKLSLGILSSVGVQKSENDQWCTHFSFGRIVDAMAPHLKSIRYSAKQYQKPLASMDYVFQADNVDVTPSPFFAHTADALRKPGALKDSYASVIRDSDVVFARGNLPFAYYAHNYCAKQNKPIVQWLVSNPIKLMQASARYGGLKDRFGRFYTHIDDWLLRRSVNRSNSVLLVNGCELGDLWKKHNPEVVVSTTLMDNDYHEREDTCQGDTVQLMFVGFVRPEKGLEYLVRALPLIQSHKNVKLKIIGPRQGYPSELEKVDRILKESGWEDRVEWAGYKSGKDMTDELDAADIFVLPTLCEGTPRVLVEARARCLPVVSTTAGGIPSSVTHEHDGLLVPPKNPEQLAQAVSRIINEDQFRKQLIQNGYRTVKEWNVDWFAGKIIEGIAEAVSRKSQ